MSVFDWIEMARSLDADGLEMYDGFFTSLDDAYLDRVGEAIHAAGFAMPMLCCSPDFTNPDPDARKRAVDREAEMIRVTRRLGGPGAVCRVLSGQRYPGGRPRAGAGVGRRLHRAGPAGRPGARRHPRAGEPLQGRLLEVPRVRPEAGRVPGTARRDPRARAFRRAVRPVQRHRRRRRSRRAAARPWPTASSACTPATATSPKGRRSRSSARPTARSATRPNLRHGVTGKGLNDYDAIFRILAEHGYRGWISIEDGMNGMDEMAESLAFLRAMVAQYFPEA